MANTVISVQDQKLDNLIKPDRAQPGVYRTNNGVYSSVFTQAGNSVQYESKGYSLTWTPRAIKYLDEFGMEDVIYDVQDAPLETKGQYARFNRTYPDVDDLFIAANDRLKHNIVVQGFQRDPFDYLSGNIEFVVGGTIEFPPELQVYADAKTGDAANFETDGDIQFVAPNGEVVYTMPQIIAKDSNFESRNMTTGKYRASVAAPGVLEFSVVLDNEWISSLDRVYPIVIDPTVVVASAYDTSGNGGRKGVRLPGGRIIEIAVSGTTVYVYKSDDNGTTFAQLCTISGAQPGAAIANIGNVCVILFNDATIVYYVTFDGTSVTNIDLNSTKKTVDSAQTSISNNLTISTNNSTGLYAAWATRRSLYPNSFNIRGATGTLQADNSITWGTIAQITAANTAGNDSTNPTMITKNDNKPYLAFYRNLGSTNKAIAGYFFNNADVTTAGYSVTIESGNSYDKGGPVAVCDSNNNIDVFWHGKDATDSAVFNIRTARSTNGGDTFGAVSKLTSGNTYNQTNPTVSMNPSNNDEYLFFQGRSSGSYDQIRRMIYSAGVWSGITDITTNTTNHAQNPSALWSKFNMNSTDAIRFIYQDLQSAAVKYDSISFNAAPLAPTLTPKANFDATTTQTLQWTFNDSDSGDTQSAYELEIYDTANTATAVLTVPKAGSTTGAYNLAANALTNGKTYQWRVRTYDAAGAQSPWSTYSTFKCSSAPQVSLTAPASGGTITSDSFTFTGSYVQAQGAPEQSFRFKLYSAANALISDSGDIIGTANSKTFSNLTNNTSYKVEFIGTSQDGVSTSTGLISFSVAYTPPATPVVTLSQDTLLARVAVTFSNPTPSGTQPTVSINNIYRRKVGASSWTLVKEGATSPYYDYMCPAGNYEYGVTGTSGAGAVSAYGTAQIAHAFSGQWLIDEAAPSAGVKFLYNQEGADITVEDDVAEVRTFAKYPRIRRGVTHYRSGTLSALYLSSDGDVNIQIDTIEAMSSTDTTYLLKLSNGRFYRVALSQLKYMTKYASAAANVSVKWTEVGDV